MIRVNSIVRMDMPRIRQLTQSAVTALEQTAEALHTEVVQAQVVPRDKGTLQGEAFFLERSESSAGKVSLIHTTPYARRLYFHPEYHFSDHENPNAKGRWFADWLPGGNEEDFTIKAYKEIYRRLTGV